MKLNFCSECAAPLKKKNSTEYTCEKGHLYWNNPRACVAVVILKEGKILVSKRAIAPNKGKYDLPGGFMEYGEDIFDAARREIREETGMKIHNLKIIGACTGEYIENVSVCDMVVVAQTWTGKPTPNDDSAALEWKDYDFLDSPKFAPDYTGLAELLKAPYNVPIDE